jgi:hypothetical protein
MCDNMLVNVSGLSGHAMPIDLNIEHLIGELKVYSSGSCAINLVDSLVLDPLTSQGPSVNLGSAQKYLSSG